MRERRRALRLGERVAEKDSRLLAGLEECSGEDERLMAVMRDKLGEVQIDD